MSKIGEWLRELNPQDVIDKTGLWAQVTTQSKTFTLVQNLLHERADEADANGEEYTRSWTFFDQRTLFNVGLQGVLDANWPRESERWPLYLDLDLDWKPLTPRGAVSMQELRDQQLLVALASLQVAIMDFAAQAASHGQLEEDPDAAAR